MFGKSIEGDRVAYWGARAIYEGHKSDYRLDLLADRQGGENISDGFLFWLNCRAIPWLRDEIKRLALPTDSDRVVSLTEYKYHIEASPNRSFGYVYIGAVERIVGEVVTPQHPDGTIKQVGGEEYIWTGHSEDVPDPGTKGTVHINQLGSGVVVGYQTEKYNETTQRFVLLVKLDGAPYWWVAQEQKRQWEKEIPNKLWILKPKVRKVYDETDPSTRQALVRKIITEMDPKDAFTVEGRKERNKWFKSHIPNVCPVCPKLFKVA